jgi:hypothetical protein
MIAAASPLAERGASAIRVARPASSWARAIEVPGLRALAKGGGGQVTSVSCGSAGNCAAGGEYATADVQQGFIEVERNGAWGTAIDVPGLAALNKGGNAQVSSVSCASAAGNCAAGGYYTDGDRNGQAFVVDERNGVWGTALEVPGIGALEGGGVAVGKASISSVSCASAGNCAAGGRYEAGHLQAFVVDERNGVWGKAIKVPGLRALDGGGGNAGVFSVSCGSAGNCAAGGYAQRGLDQGFVATERNGVWGKAIEVPGLAALNKGDAEVDSVSCASAGSCAAGGSYETRRGGLAFVAVERNGRWGKAIAVPGLAALDTGGGLADVGSVSCPSAGNCTAGGVYYTSSSGAHSHAFVVAEKHGRWGRAMDVPGLSALDVNRLGQVTSVSCGLAGNCAAVGEYSRRGAQQGFVVTERTGHWGRAIAIPGLAALNKRGLAEVPSVSCVRAGACAAGGSYWGNGTGAFVVSRTG